MRTHLLGMAGAVLALSAVVGLALTARGYSSAKRRSVTATRDAARQVAAAVDRDLSQAATLAAASAPTLAASFAQVAAIAADPELCKLQFSGVGVIPSEGAVHILTADGTVLCSSAAAAHGRSYASAAWFPRLVKGELVVVDDARDPVSEDAEAIVAAPVLEPSGRLLGALVSAYSLRPLAPALADTFGGPLRRQFVIVGGDGTVLSSSIDPAQAGRRFPALADGATGVDSRDTKRIWGAAPVDRLGWRIWAGTNEARALGPARAERERLALVLAVALAAALGLALAVNRRFVRPILGLSLTVHRAETEPGARAAVAGPAELAELAECLNRMLATRQHNEQLVAELAGELEATAISLVQAREQERQALAIALHDTTLQGLIAAMWQVDALTERDGGSPALERLRQDLETLVNQTRAVTRELRPPALQETGLGAAVDELAHRTAGGSGFAIDVEDRLAGARFSLAVEMLVYRIVQEALQNVRRHAQASSVRIVLERQDGMLRATVTDDGIGVDESSLAERASAGQFGIASMRDTIRLAKGRFSVTRGDPAGTVVNVEVPVSAGAPLSNDGPRSDGP